MIKRLVFNRYGQMRAGAHALMFFGAMLLVLVLVLAAIKPFADAERAEMESLCAEHGMTLTFLRQGAGKYVHNEGVCRDARGALYVID